MQLNVARLFEKATIGSLDLLNRIAVAPMTRISGMANGCAGPLVKAYYEAYARGGYGLIFTEGTYTDLAFSQGYRNQPGLATVEHAESWRPVVDAVHAAGARFILQLMHAWALAQYNAYRRETVGPSSIQAQGRTDDLLSALQAYSPRANR